MEVLVSRAERKPDPKRPAMCEECNSNPSKYTCPGCSVRSCGLPCVRAHKSRTGCTGKRKATSFVPLSKFDDNQLISDYNLLEEIRRVADSAKRGRMQLCGYHHFRLPYHLRSLRSAAFHRRTKVLFLPSGMSRREKNQSRYDTKNKIIYWTIEWRFHSADVSVVDHEINENAPLHSVIEKYLNPGPWNRKLRQYSKESPDDLKLVIRKYPKGRESPFYKLDVRAPIKEQLASVILLENPVIHVFLPSHIFDFEVIKVEDRYPRKPDQKIERAQSCQQGVTFKEEEIEDTENPSEPNVLDLISHPKYTHIEPEKLNHISDSHPSCQMENNSEPNLVDFEFEQDLIDAYSDLLAEVNPDEFLNFGCDILGELQDNIDFSTLGQDELEEGEIPWA
uniref:HIT-type domain-containing protein n=1 Tax=Kalanchoe fedtschenkoi TaxID=63787 RepID=A0A7N0TR99_KALFE